MVPKGVTMELQKIECVFTICKIDNVEQVDFTRGFTFLSKTADEISLVCEAEKTPSEALEIEPGWRALKISDVLDFNMIGVIAKLSKILAEAKICIFVVSTYNTDYIFMKVEDYDRGIQALIHNGYTVF